jgi:D-glycero-D-manno-heptose 1,7-bisphosphate phosphatase
MLAVLEASRAKKGRNLQEGRAAVFFDRDGTLIQDADYCDDPAKVKVFEGTADALRQLKSQDFKIVIVTNQSGIGRGFMTEEDYRAVEREFESQLGSALIDVTYFCPHSPEESCACRKPEPGMLLQAAEEHQIDLRKSYFVGDKDSDMECGQRAGTKTILVQTGYGRSADHARPDAVVAGVKEAAAYILKESAK